MENEKVIKEENCNRCNYSWFPKSMKTPKQCPKCKSPYWNKMRIRTPKNGDRMVQ